MRSRAVLMAAAAGAALILTACETTSERMTRQSVQLCGDGNVAVMKYEDGPGTLDVRCATPAKPKDGDPR